MSVAKSKTLFNPGVVHRNISVFFPDISEREIKRS